MYEIDNDTGEANSENLRQPGNHHFPVCGVVTLLVVAPLSLCLSWLDRLSSPEVYIVRAGENSTSRSLIISQTWGDRPGQLATNQNKQTKSCLSFHSQPESQFYLSRSNEKRLNGSRMSRQSGPRCNYKNSSWNYSPWQFTFFLFNSSIHSLFPLSSCFEVGQS